MSSTNRIDDDALREWLSDARTFLEPLWSDFKREKRIDVGADGKMSTGMCRFSVVFLHPLLNEMSGRKWKILGGLSSFHPADAGWDRRNGRPNSTLGADDGVGGLRTDDGRWISHYWLTDGEIIADLTADQAGWDRVVVTDAADDRYLANWKPAFVREHMVDVAKRGDAWREAWRDAMIAEERRPPGP